jgi:hypothetical protein
MNGNPTGRQERNHVKRSPLRSEKEHIESREERRQRRGGKRYTAYIIAMTILRSFHRLNERIKNNEPQRGREFPSIVVHCTVLGRYERASIPGHVSRLQGLPFI